jgi:hypothetical protein
MCSGGEEPDSGRPYTIRVGIPRAELFVETVAEPKQAESAVRRISPMPSRQI